MQMELYWLLVWNCQSFECTLYGTKYNMSTGQLMSKCIEGKHVTCIFLQELELWRQNVSKLSLTQVK